MVYALNVLQGNVIIAAAAMLFILGLLGCENQVYLPSNVVDPARIAASSIADKKFNVVRFVTFGPQPEQIYGYVLYEDDSDVRTTGAPLAKLGKMNLKEVLDDYDRTRRARGWHSASSPVIREVLRGGNLIALTASDDMLDVHLWEDKALSNRENKVIIILTYDDRRTGDRGMKPGY
jgi:hypothetical protein